MALVLRCTSLDFQLVIISFAYDIIIISIVKVSKI